MSQKRLITFKDRAEHILQAVDARGKNISAFTNDAVAMWTLPHYATSLIGAAHVLLDYVDDHIERWSSDGQPVINVSARDFDLRTRNALAAGINWLKTCPIRDPAIFEDILGCYCRGPMDGGISDGFEKDLIVQSVINRIQEFDPGYMSPVDGLYGVAYALLEHWKDLWDWDSSYDLLFLTVMQENSYSCLDPYEVIDWLRIMEEEVFLETFGEKQFFHL